LSSPNGSATQFVVTKRSFNLKPVAQIKTQWCWAACCEMFVDFHGGVKHSQEEFVLDVLAKEFDKNVCSTPTEFVPKLAKQMADKQIGTREYIKTVPDARYSHDAIKRMVDDGRIMMVGAGSHARIIYGYGSQGGAEKLLVMDPNGGKPQTFEWTEFDSCAWIVWCKKEAAGGEKKTDESK
jgi:Papain-like cysteine protease AvrRpt2